jgi:hypothetical protein
MGWRRVLIGRQPVADGRRAGEAPAADCGGHIQFCDPADAGRGEKMKRNLAALVLATIVIGGCSGEDPFNPDRPRRAPATQVGGQLAPVDQQGNPLGGQPAPPPPPPGVVREGVKPGVSGKGEGYGPGPIATPISVYFRVPERLVFNVEIPQAMNLYKATHGHFPKTHEEFMQKIIAENAIALPELRSPQERYVYDAEKAAHQSQYDPMDPPLLIERPR